MRRDRGGFTLIELLVALVVSAILAGIIFQLLLGESRFARVQTAREEVQQNARAALEVITSELRGVGPDAILEATSTSIRFATPRAWGLVCGYPDPAGGPRTVAVIFPSDAVPSLSDGSAGGADRLAIPPVGVDADGRPIEVWRFLGVSDATGSTGGLVAAVTECTKFAPDPALPPPSAPWKTSRARLFAGAGSDGIPAGLAIGEPVYVVDPPVRYATGKSSPGDETWIKRSHGSSGAMQPLAGPTSEESGLTFTYFDATGADITAALAAGSAVPSAVRKIIVSVVTLSRAQFSGEPQQERASAAVYLRNRI